MLDCCIIPVLSLIVSCLLSSFLVSRTLSGSLFASPSSLCFLYQVCTSHSELRTYSNKVCCCTAVYHTKYQVYHTKYHTAVSYTDRASLVDCCIIPVLSLFVCDSSCSNAFPFVLYRHHCRYHRCKDRGAWLLYISRPCLYACTTVNMWGALPVIAVRTYPCLLYTSPSPRDKRQSRMPSSA